MRGVKVGWVCVAVAVALQGEAVGFHRSFRSREVGIGGGASVMIPVDARVDKAIDEGRAQAADRVKVVVGRVTRVLDGRTFRLVTGGGTLVPVRLEGVEVTADAERAKVSSALLKNLVQGRVVRVEFRSKDEDGFLLGTVTYNKTNVNLAIAAERKP